MPYESLSGTIGLRGAPPKCPQKITREALEEFLSYKYNTSSNLAMILESCIILSNKDDPKGAMIREILKHKNDIISSAMWSGAGWGFEVID